MSDHWLFSGHGGVGVEVLAPYEFWGDPVGDNTVGLRFELGHTLRQDPSYTLSSPSNTPEDEEPISTTSTSLGTLSTHGGYFTVDFFARF